MTEADHADLSRRLALAIGWPESGIAMGVIHDTYLSFPGNECILFPDNKWRRFDYRDPAVIWPIAERYNVFPTWNTQHNKWTVGKAAPRGYMSLIVFGDTAAEAVARAVIGGAR